MPPGTKWLVDFYGDEIDCACQLIDMCDGSAKAARAAINIANQIKKGRRGRQPEEPSGSLLFARAIQRELGCSDDEALSLLAAHASRGPSAPEALSARRAMLPPARSGQYLSRRSFRP